MNSPPPSTCDLCGTRLTGGAGALAAVPDSSALHPRRRALDGLRLVRGCSPAHLDRLRAHYRVRPFVLEELWSGQIGRAQDSHPYELTPAQIANLTGLLPTQIARALHWRRHQDDEAAPAPLAGGSPPGS
ncbi:hypothetical protein [Streptomyces albiaxialis]